MGNYLGYRDGGKTNEEGLMKFLYQTFNGGFPISAVPTSLQATQRAAGANLSVDLAVGNVHLPNPAASYSYWGWADAVNNVALNAADPTNPRIDVIVAYVDLTVLSTANNNNPNALKFTAIAGTPAGSPTAPSDSAIQTALGATTPFQKIATVTVGAAATSVTNAVISDVRTSMSLKVSAGGAATTGWNSLLYAPNTVTPLGNRSYSMVFNGNDLTPTLSAGMRLRTTRTVNAPTQCTSLNGTTQFYSKSSPVGMTFTVTCTAMGARKLNAYSAQWFGGRTTGTNGFRYGITASGQLIFEVQPGNATTKTVTSYQSVPLNKGFRFAFQIDLAGTCQIMLDGVAIPSTTAGTATSLTQAVADWQLGAAGGVGFTNGKMAQDAIFSAKLADATVLSYEGQSYSGAETSLISAYSFSNSITDLNTTNANNLTANGSAVATNADSPFGCQADGTISATLDYAIIQKVSFSTNTTVVVQVPEGCTIPTSGGVTAVAYSGNKAPYGFPDQRTKWQIEMLSRGTGQVGSATSGTYYYFNHTLNLPIGEWQVAWSLDASVTSTSAGTNQIGAGISTSSSTATASDLPNFSRLRAGNSIEISGHISKTKAFSIASATPIYFLLICSTTTTTGFVSSDNGSYGGYITAENAYL